MTAETIIAFGAVFAVGLVLGAAVGSYALWKVSMKYRRPGHRAFVVTKYDPPDAQETAGEPLH